MIKRNQTNISLDDFDFSTSSFPSIPSKFFKSKANVFCVFFLLISTFGIFGWSGKASSIFPRKLKLDSSESFITSRFKPN